MTKKEIIYYLNYIIKQHLLELESRYPTKLPYELRR